MEKSASLLQLPIRPDALALFLTESTGKALSFKGHSSEMWHCPPATTYILYRPISSSFKFSSHRRISSAFTCCALAACLEFSSTSRLT